jgi:hypothetical protein
MLITSAVAMFFSCSGATEFSAIGFDYESSVLGPRLLFETCRLKTVIRDPHRLLRWTDEDGEGYVSSSFLGAELSILTPLPERSVRRTL